MRMYTAVLLHCVLVSFSHPVMAIETKFGVDALRWTLALDDGPDANVNSARLRLSFEISDLFDIELQAGGSGEDKLSGGDVEVKYFYDIVGKFKWASNQATLYGILGMSSVRISDSLGKYKISKRQAGFSYGVAAGYRISEKWSINTDYMMYVKMINIC